MKLYADIRICVTGQLEQMVEAGWNPILFGLAFKTLVFVARFLFLILLCEAAPQESSLFSFYSLASVYFGTEKFT